MSDVDTQGVVLLSMIALQTIAVALMFSNAYMLANTMLLITVVLGLMDVIYNHVE